MLQGNVEAYGGVRKLLSSQLCWPLSQPKVKNKVHPKHIFSNAVLINAAPVVYQPFLHLLSLLQFILPLTQSLSSSSNATVPGKNGI